MSRQKKIKIAIFHNLPKGGAKRHLYEITKRLEKTYNIDEYKLSTASPYLNLSKFTKISRAYVYHGGNGIKSVTQSILKLPKIHKKIARDINCGGYDLVLTNHDYFTKSPYVHRYLTVPSLYICHEPQREFYEDHNIHSPRIREKIINVLRLPIKYIDKINTKAAGGIIANSKYSNRYLKKVYRMKPSLVYPGVDNKEFIYSNKKKNYILAIGSLMPIKGHNFIVGSLGKIEKKYRPSLIIVGSASAYYKKKLIKIAKINNVGIKILNKVTDSQIKKLFSTALAYVSGAHKEPFNLCILEAMASGTPAIVVEGGGAGEQIINGVNGYIVKRDENEFADKLLLIVKAKNKKDIGIKARKSADAWSWHRTTEKLDKIIRKNIER